MRGLLLLLLAVPGFASAAPILVAVEQGSSTVGSASDVVTQLNNDTYYDFTATQVVATSIDSASELAAYDVVILGDSGYNDAYWSATMASALKTWVSGGGGVVAVGWVDFGIRASSPRDSDLDEVVPIDAYPDSVNYFCNTSLSLV